MCAARSLLDMGTTVVVCVVITRGIRRRPLVTIMTVFTVACTLSLQTSQQTKIAGMHINIKYHNYINLQDRGNRNLSLIILVTESLKQLVFQSFHVHYDIT